MINDKEDNDKELRLAISKMNLSEEEKKINLYKDFKSKDDNIKLEKLRIKKGKNKSRNY